MKDWTEPDITKLYKNWLLKVERCEKDPELAQFELERCKRDPLYFISAWCWTYDPRLPKFKSIPFIMYPFQEEMVEGIISAYRGKYDLLIEKSRDMGFSWVCFATFLYLMRFENEFTAGVGSRKLEYVDNFAMGSLLEKVRFLITRLPLFMRGGYHERKSTKLKYVAIPETGSTLTGETGDEIGRGDRKSIYMLDEFAFLPRSDRVMAAVSETTDCRIYGSTPNGKGNEFSRLRWKTDIKVLTLHWSKHPKKTQEWYEKRKKDLEPEVLAQEIDISYEKSKKGRVHRWYDSSKHATKIIPYNKDHPLFITADWGIGDPTAIIFLQDYGGKVKILKYIEEADMDIEEIMVEILRVLRKWGVQHFHVSGWYGDPDGNNRERITGESIFQWFKKNYNIHFRYKYPNVIKNRVGSVKKLGKSDRIEVSKDQYHIIECFENYRYPEKEHGENEKPVHDWTSHVMTALEYYCVFEHPITAEQKKPKDVITSYNWR